MRKSIIFVAAVFLVFAFGVQSGAQPSFSGNDPQYRTSYPQDRRAGPKWGDPRMNDRRSFVGQLSTELVRHAEYMAQESWQYFMGWNGVITDREQVVLFKAEEFAASCRMFNRLVQDQTNYFRGENIRSNLYNASRYVAQAFHEYENQRRLGGIQDNFNRMRRDGRPFDWRPGGGGAVPMGIVEIRRLLGRIEAEFSNWR